MRRLVLTWRRQGGEWREVELERHVKKYTLDNLDCGTAHHLYITPYNAIGEDNVLGYAMLFSVLCYRVYWYFTAEYI